MPAQYSTTLRPSRRSDALMAFKSFKYGGLWAQVGTPFAGALAQDVEDGSAALLSISVLLENYWSIHLLSPANEVDNKRFVVRFNSNVKFS